MADDDIVITWQANQTSLMQALLQQQTAMQKSVDKLNQIGTAGEKAGKGMSSGFEQAASWGGKLIGQLTGIGSTIGGVMALVSVLKSEYEDLVNRQKSAADTQINFAKSMQMAVMNFVPDETIKNAGQLSTEISKAAADVGVDPSVMAQAVSSALSAKGDRTNRQAIDATKAAARIAPNLGPETMAPLASAAMDIGKATGATPEEAIGFLKRMQVASHIDNMDSLARHSIKAFMAMTSRGTSPEKAAAVMAAMSQAETDPQGRISGNATLKLSEQLAERIPYLKDEQGKLHKAGIDEQIAAMWADPKLRKKFFNPEGATWRVPDKATGKMRSQHFPAPSFDEKALAAVHGILGDDVPDEPITKGTEPRIPMRPAGNQGVVPAGAKPVAPAVTKPVAAPGGEKPTESSYGFLKFEKPVAAPPRENLFRSAYKTALRTTISVKEGAKEYEDTLKSREEIPVMRTDERSRIFTAATEKAKSEDIQGAEAATTVKGLDELEAANGIDRFERFWDSIKLRMAKDKTGTAAEILLDKSISERNRVYNAGDNTFSAEQSAAILRAADSMEKVATHLFALQKRENQQPVQVNVEVTAPKGTSAKPGIGALDRGDQ